jgi:hypothetical protein
MSEEGELNRIDTIVYGHPMSEEGELNRIAKIS